MCLPSLLVIMRKREKMDICCMLSTFYIYEVFIFYICYLINPTQQPSQLSIPLAGACIHSALIADQRYTKYVNI